MAHITPCNPNWDVDITGSIKPRLLYFSRRDIIHIVALCMWTSCLALVIANRLAVSSHIRRVQLNDQHGYPRWLHSAMTAPIIPTAPARPAATAPVGLAAPPVKLALDVEGVDTRVTL